MKKQVRLNENELRNMVSEAVQGFLNEYGGDEKSQFQLGRLAQRKGEGKDTLKNMRANPDKYPIFNYAEKAAKAADKKNGTNLRWHHDFDWGRKTQRNLQDTVDDIEDAGLNPMDASIKSKDVRHTIDGRQHANASDVHALNRLFGSEKPIKPYPEERGVYEPFDRTLQDYFGPDAKVNPASALKNKRGAEQTSQEPAFAINETKLDRIIKECIRKVLKEETFRGVEGTDFIWHGTNSDPEIVYNGRTYNYWDIENTLWEEFKEQGGSEADGEEAFNAFCQENAPSLFMDLEANEA